MNNKARKYHVVKDLMRIPSLVHGFGTRHLREEDIISSQEFSSFRHVSLRQTHSDIIRTIKEFPVERMDGDAIITNSPDILLIIKTADCLPVLIVDPQRRTVAAVHCGWRGTLKRVIGKTLWTMQQRFGSDPTSFFIAFGPCIDKSCYEVGKDVRVQFENQGLQFGVFDGHPSKKEKYLFDLKETNRAQVLSMGVPEDNIFSIDLCTHCDESFFSYRRHKDYAGRLINFIGLC
jgi:YfiH family protein